jgi:hypothetical protein
MPRCVGSKGDGGACERIVKASQKYCYSHDPARSVERQRNAARGGKRGGRGRPLLEVRDIADQLQALIDKVLAGELARADAAVIGQLLNYKRAVIATALTVRQQEEMEARLEEVEAILEQRKAGA